MRPRHGRAWRLDAIRASTALVACVALAGCGIPGSEAENEGAGAGVAATVGDVQLSNLLIVSGEEGGQGIMCGAGNNSSGQERSVDMRLASGAGTTMSIPAQGSADLNCQSDDPVVLDEVPAAPGALADVTVAVNGEQTVARVPVLYPYSETPYGTLAPPGFTGTPTP